MCFVVKNSITYEQMYNGELQEQNTTRLDISPCHINSLHIRYKENIRLIAKHWRGRAMTQAVIRRRGGPGSIPGQSMWDLW
jgi:hypothetical protein